jgi:hypothetical protein
MKKHPHKKLHPNATAYNPLQIFLEFENLKGKIEFLYVCRSLP